MLGKEREMPVNWTMKKMRIKLSNLKRRMLKDPSLVHHLWWCQNLEFQSENQLIHISIALNRDLRMRKMKKSWNTLKNNYPPPLADRKRSDPPKLKYTNKNFLFLQKQKSNISNIIINTFLPNRLLFILSILRPNLSVI